MSTFCHDSYDHPLLWCDGKRRLVERQDALQSMVLVKQQKEEERQKRINEQREYRDMILKHYPWGRPGAGAPGDHTRRGNILAQGLFPVSRPDCRQYTDVDYGKTGRSAMAQRTNQPPPSSHFQRVETANVPPDYNRNFSKQMNSKLMHGWTDPKPPQHMDRETSTWSPQKAADPKPKTLLPPMQCCCSKCCCNCGLMFRDEHKVSKGATRDTRELAPNSPDAHQKQLKMSRQQAGAGKRVGRMAGAEQAPLLARRKAQQQSVNHLSSTDVTNPPNPSKFVESDHLTELCRQIRQKERREEVQRELELDASVRHFATLDSLWGRPGHGAPRPIKNKLNLDDLLYKVPFKADYVL